jgi:hypothetical protein
MRWPTTSRREIQRQPAHCQAECRFAWKAAVFAGYCVGDVGGERRTGSSPSMRGTGVITTPGSRCSTASASSRRCGHSWRVAPIGAMTACVSSYATQRTSGKTFGLSSTRSAIRGSARRARPLRGPRADQSSRASRPYRHCGDRAGGEDRRGSDVLGPRRSPRSRRAAGVGDVAGELGAGAAVLRSTQ